MHPINRQAKGADETLASAVRIDTDESRILVVELTLVGFDELSESLSKRFNLCLHFIDFNKVIFRCDLHTIIPYN